MEKGTGVVAALNATAVDGIQCLLEDRNIVREDTSCSEAGNCCFEERILGCMADPAQY